MVHTRHWADVCHLPPPLIRLFTNILPATGMLLKVTQPFQTYKHLVTKCENWLFFYETNNASFQNKTKKNSFTKIQNTPCIFTQSVFTVWFEVVDRCSFSWCTPRLLLRTGGHSDQQYCEEINNTLNDFTAKWEDRRAGGTLRGESACLSDVRYWGLSQGS